MQKIVESLKKEIYPYLTQNIIVEMDKLGVENLTEIRIRNSQKPILKYINHEKILNNIVSKEDIEFILEKLTSYSIYSVQNEINNGYITIKGGHRVGIVGTCVMNDNDITNVKNISSINIRIARQVLGCSEELYNRIYVNMFENTIIASLPNKGKTTYIRDLTRILSSKGYTISVIDERSEIACMYNGTPQMDIGIRTDVINKCYKYVGIRMAIRSMSPDIIVVDEIGSSKDIDEIENAVLSGIKLLVTAHAKNIEELKNGNIGNLLNKKIFKYVVFLNSIGSYNIWECEK